MRKIDTDSDVVIKIQGLWKYFDGKPVLKNISVEIPTGKITIIMGRSGCGKTVLVKHIVGLLKPTEGKIFFKGRDVTDISAEERLDYLKKFGFLFQNSALFDWLTVEENILFPLYECMRIKDKAVLRQKLEPILEIIGMKGHEKKYPGELSGGMKKRVALGRAIIHNPEVVILDEPTSGIDPVTSSSIEDLILSVKKEISSTFIAITHDIKSALKLADYIIFMKDGEVIWDGNPSDIFDVSDEEVQLFLRRL